MHPFFAGCVWNVMMQKITRHFATTSALKGDCSISATIFCFCFFTSPFCQYDETVLHGYFFMSSCFLCSYVCQSKSRGDCESSSSFCRRTEMPVLCYVSRIWCTAATNMQQMVVSFRLVQMPLKSLLHHPVLTLMWVRTSPWSAMHLMIQEWTSRLPGP